MSNTWKARCVRDKEPVWKIGETIEVVNGTALEDKCHGWGGCNEKATQSFENWCEYQDTSEWELITTTLRDHINQLSNREFAEMIVDIDSDFEHYITTDDATWYDREDAIKHQIELLEGEYNE